MILNVSASSGRLHCVYLCAEGLWVNCGCKISIRVLTWGHVSVSLKITQRSGEEEFLLIKHHPSPEGKKERKKKKKHQMKAPQGSSSQSGHVRALIHISTFPQPLRWHVQPERFSQLTAPFGNTSPLSKQSEELRTGNLVCNKTTINWTEGQLWMDWRWDKHYLFQINPSEEEIPPKIFFFKLSMLNSKLTQP